MTATFILDIGNRDYTEWSFKLSEADTDTSIHIKHPLIFPASAHLFHRDVIDQHGKILHSPVREKSDICGVLLTNEKTYGRFNKTGKLLYKCVPDDIHLPCFLIPYEETDIGFSKVKMNKYITFVVKEWTNQTKHPIGTLTNTLGNVDEKEAYTTYQMACKEINQTLKQLNAVSLRALRENTLNPIPYYCNEKAIEDRRAYTIISIDPIGCKDIDDALGITHLNDTTILSIYIANVPMMLEYLKLWPALTERIATIYLPNKKHPMLPIALSENSCSLLEKESRLAFVMDFYIKEKQILEIKYKPVIIKVERNFAYDEPELLMRSDYKSIFKTICDLNNTQTRKIKNIKYVDTIKSSHEVVEYSMLLMNHHSAQMLEEKQKGIFRGATTRPFVNLETITDYENLPTDMKQILQNVSGHYCGFEHLAPHELIAGGLDSYTHITSPIRRLVDCINMLLLQQDDFKWSAEASAFLKKWNTPKGIEIINAKTKAIRRLQNQMELFELYEKNSQQNYTGIVFAREEVTSKNETKFKYKVYIRSLKLLTNVVTNKKLNNYSTSDFSVHLFMDETKMAKKIRLHLGRPPHPPGQAPILGNMGLPRMV